jgi:molybdopterin converting factor subunit 1
MATIKVTYFAVLKDLAGKSQEDLDVEAGTSVAKIYSRLAERYGFPLALSDIRVAINDDFASLDHGIKAHDHLVFIPPVAGG